MFSCFQSTVPQQTELVMDITPHEHAQTSSNLTVVCYSDTNKRNIMPCEYKWTRKMDTSLMELKQIKGNSYMCQPDDLGAIIQVEIKSQRGNAVVTFGPIMMDLTLKPNIENIMVSDCCREIVKITDYGETKQCYLSIASKSIQISDMMGNLLLEVDYFVDSPVFKINPKQPNKVSIMFVLSSYQPLKQFYDSLFKRPTAFEGKSIDLSFVNRISRDMFIFSHKIFSSKKDLKVSEFLMALQQRNRIKNLVNIDSLLVVQYLRRDLKRYIKMYNQQKNQKQICLTQVQRLQEQITNVRNSYTSYIVECLKQVHPHTQNSLIMQLDEKNFEYNFEEQNKYLKFKLIKQDEQITLLKKVQRKRTTKKIFTGNLSASQASIQKLVNDLDTSSLIEDQSSEKIKRLETQNLELAKKITQLIADYQDMKYQKQLLQNQKLNTSIRSNQSQQAVTTINKLIGDIVQLKRINLELSLQNEKLAGKKKNPEEQQVISYQKLKIKLEQTQRLLQISQQSYQRMKQMFQKTQAKYDTPRSSSYHSSVSSVSTAKGKKNKMQTPKRKSSIKKAKLSQQLR